MNPHFYLLPLMLNSRALTESLHVPYSIFVGGGGGGSKIVNSLVLSQ